jgi:hypothetical protein
MGYNSKYPLCWIKCSNGWFGCHVMYEVCAKTAYSFEIDYDKPIISAHNIDVRRVAARFARLKKLRRTSTCDPRSSRTS